MDQNARRDGEARGRRAAGAGANRSRSATPAGAPRSGSGRPADRPTRGSGSPQQASPQQASPRRTAHSSDRAGAGREEPGARGGARLAPKTPRLPEPAIASGVTGRELDRAVWTQLRTLSKENAEGVAQHLVMVARLLEDDIEAAQAHAETAVRRAGRVPAAREALGLVAYRRGDWARALGEFRTVRRLSGSNHLLPLMVDCERALGNRERALGLAMAPEARSLDLEDRIELAIVVSGIRRDLGQPEAAAACLEIPELATSSRTPWAARLRYAYAEAQLALGDVAGARRWFSRAADADTDLATDAAERLEELDGVAYTDLLADEDGASVVLDVDDESDD